MRRHAKIIATLIAAAVYWAAAAAWAEQAAVTDKPPAATPAVEVPAAKQKAEAASEPSPRAAPASSIHLQTTVTGNQEQPRVLYILPWQSPAAEAVDFAPLESEQKAVFKHLEREELARELDAAAQ